MATPAPVRQAVIDLMRGRLATITRANGYLFDVGPTRIHMMDVVNATTSCPALMIIQRTEAVEWATVGRHLQRTLSITVGFVAEYNGPDPDEHAVKFMSEIERAVGFEHTITVTDYELNTITATHPVAFILQGNAINVAEPLEGRIFGQVDYGVQYFTSHLDPRKL